MFSKYSDNYRNILISQFECSDNYRNVSRTSYGENNPLCSRYIFKANTFVFPLKTLELTLTFLKQK